MQKWQQLQFLQRPLEALKSNPSRNEHVYSFLLLEKVVVSVAILYLLYLCRLCMTTAYNTIAGDVLRYNNMKKTKLTTFTALVQKHNSAHIKTRHRMQMLNWFKVSKSEKNVSLKSRQDAEPSPASFELWTTIVFLNQQASLLAVSC